MKKADPPLIYFGDDKGEFCVLEGLQNVDDDYEIAEGVSRADDFPDDAQFKMSKRHKKQVALADNLNNLEAQPVVSERLKEFVESSKAKKVEFLPVAIVNHKGKKIPEPYYIMNPLTIIDCIDKAQSNITWNSIDPDAISGVLKLVLDQGKIDPEALFFRAKHMPHRVFVNRKFAKKLEDAGFTGITFMEPAEFMG